MTPEDVSRLIVERVNAGDADGIAELYEADAVMAYPQGTLTVGREAVREVYAGMLGSGARFRREEPLPTLRNGDLAMTSTRALDGTGGRVQVVRRQADGSWLRIIDRPEMPAG
ncbi:nuclear transport factor 2 family protein [Streptomyces sp. GC420]|uniref:YybH family protein n=1 Tax=Streptomyces sp. GC420 TaxID=2697568 RepID=UPI001FB7EE54|nr:nuclear transport factor 2 family protein [Streptomyces sp. GC420]